ncbi:MAG: hypothetical protein NHB14_02810 [Desulfosporosinus sp.]|jgi:hypothetical protein|nr:hypothetical protein [Desulfosporosinus sp.]
MEAVIYAAGGTGFAFFMTALGAALVFFVGNKPNATAQKVLLGFAAGVMIAASVWSLLIPAYVKLEEKLRTQYEELLGRQVQNKVDIYYHGKLLRQHSIGQRASALILFILTQDNNDVIFIDQPEDDLDNKVIYDEVITAIAQKKPYMQFLFATHNANIPVLGDSERVLVVEFQETKIDVAQGNIDLDSTHKQIVDIMEGGKEAFDKRQLIYTSWH